MKVLKLVFAVTIIFIVLVTGVNLTWFTPWDEPIYPSGSLMFEVTDSNKGILYFSEGSPAYRGGWDDGLAHGAGESFYISRRRQAGSVEYSGQWQYGLFHGMGELFHSNGHLIYSGDWQEGLRHGQGKEYSADGSLRYQGGWQYGLRHGLGSEYRDDILVYHGEWERGQRHGQGEEYQGNTLIYRGGWRNGLRNGWGEEFYPQGSMLYAGTWRDGYYLRPESIYLPDGSQPSLTQGYFHLWALQRGRSLTVKLWEEAQNVAPYIESVTEDPWEQALLYSLVKLPDEFYLEHPDSRLEQIRDKGLMDSMRGIIQLPRALADDMVYKGVRIFYVYGVTGSGMFNMEKAAGLAVGGLLMVRLDVGDSRRITLHEIGHAVDFVVVDWTGEFGLEDLRAVRKKEGRLFPDYYASSDTEYFAEFFARYFQDASTRAILAKRAPQSFELFQNLFGATSETLSKPYKMQVKVASVNDHIVITAADIRTDFYVRSYHSSYEELVSWGWDTKMFLEFLTRPSYLCDSRKKFGHEGGFVLYLARDNKGDYSMGSSQLIEVAPPRTELPPVGVAKTPLWDKVSIGFSRMANSLKGLSSWGD